MVQKVTPSSSAPFGLVGWVVGGLGDDFACVVFDLGLCFA